MTPYPLDCPIYGGYGFALAQSVAIATGAQSAAVEKPVKPIEELERQQEAPFISRSFCGPGFDGLSVADTALYWQMRRYHAIALAFAVATAPAIAGTRGIEVVDNLGNQDFADEVKGAAEKDLLPALNDALPGAMECLQLGHWLQELVWGLRDGKNLYVERVKSFFPGETQLYKDKYGDFVGYMVGSEYRDARYAYLSVNNPHIHRILGESRNEYCKSEWHRAQQSEKNADRTERKASSRQMMLGLPTGSDYKDGAGRPLVDEKVANLILRAAVDGEIVTVPRSMFRANDIKSDPKLADIPAIKMDAFDWGNIGPSLEAHLNRLDRLDRSMMQAWRRPAREAMEAQHGAKNEGEAQGQIGVTDTEQIHADRCHQWDRQVTDRWGVARWGKRYKAGMIRTKPAPLSDPQQTFLQEFAKLLGQSQVVAPEFLRNVNLRELGNRTELPLISEEDVAAKKVQEQKDAADAMKQQQQMMAATKGSAGDGAPADGQQKLVNGNGKAKPPEMAGAGRMSGN